MSIFRVSKKEAVFFDWFIEFAQLANKAAEALEDLIHDYTDVSEKIVIIEKYENQCDLLVHTILERLNASFITPIDREDIDRIAHELDDVVDNIEASAHRFRMYNVETVKEEAKTLGCLITLCTAELVQLMTELKRMTKSKSLQKKIIEINRIENEGDNVYRNAIRELFLCETNAVEIIKWKDMFQLLEDSLDACEDVANIIEGVVMKHA
jgi:predicted phosphate transport protein (TIGR00153 family)